MWFTTQHNESFVEFYTFAAYVISVSLVYLWPSFMNDKDLLLARKELFLVDNGENRLICGQKMFLHLSLRIVEIHIFRQLAQDCVVLLIRNVLAVRLIRHIKDLWSLVPHLCNRLAKDLLPHINSLLIGQMTEK